jgi:hypothetical protein
MATPSTSMSAGRTTTQRRQPAERQTTQRMAPTRYMGQSAPTNAQSAIQSSYGRLASATPVIQNIESDDDVGKSKSSLLKKMQREVAAQSQIESIKSQLPSLSKYASSKKFDPKAAGMTKEAYGRTIDFAKKYGKEKGLF